MNLKVGVALLACSLPLLAQAEDNPDQAFYKNAAQAGIAEVEMGKMAQEKASSPAVKEFAAMMVKDHSAANSKLKAIAKAKGVELPTEPDVMQKAMAKKTDMKSGESFDKDYIQGQIKAHKDTIDLLNKEIERGKDAQAKAFAAETLPKVRMHLEHIEKIAATAGVK
jgi:putative membrane protein